MYRVGDVVALTWRVIDPSHNLIDATVSITVDGPEGAPLGAPEPTGLSEGTYSAEFTPVLPGRHVARWAATGAVERAQVEVVNVAEADHPAGLISLEQAREHLNIPPGEHSEDEELRRFIDAASRVVENYTGEVIARRSLTEKHYATGDGRILLNAAPVMSLSVVTDDAQSTTYEASLLDPAAGIVAIPLGLYGPVRVLFQAGRAVVPENYQMATAIICAHLWTTQRVSSVTGVPGFGGEVTQPTGRGYLIPNQAAQLLGGKAPNRP